MGLVWDNKKADATLDEIKAAAFELQHAAAALTILLNHIDDVVLRLREALSASRPTASTDSK